MYFVGGPNSAFAGVGYIFKLVLEITVTLLQACPTAKNESSWGH